MSGNVAKITTAGSTIPGWLKNSVKINNNGSVGTTTPDTTGLVSGPGAPKTTAPTFSQNLANKAIGGNQQGVLPQTPAVSHVQPTQHPTSVTTGTDGSVTTKYPNPTSSTTSSTPTQTPYQKYVADNNASGKSSSTEAVFNGQGLPGSTPTNQNSGGQITHIDLNGNTTDANGNIIQQNGAGNGTTNTNTSTQNTNGVTTDANGDVTRSGMINKLANQQPIDSYNDLQGQLSSIKQQETDLGNAYTKSGGAINRTAGFLNRAQGEQGLAQNQYNQGMSYLGSQYSGVASQLGAANTQQDLQRQGLSSALTASQPITPGYNQQVLDPRTGLPVNQTGGTSSMSKLPPQGQTLVQTLAQRVKDNKTTMEEALSELSNYGQPGIEALNEALGGSNFNPNIATTNVGIQSSQEVQKQQYQVAHQQAQNLVAQANDMIKKWNLNPSNINEVNHGLQVIASNVSNPYYQGMLNYFTDIASRYAQILTPAGGNATDAVRSAAKGMIDSTAQGQSIQQVFNMLDQQAQAVIAGSHTNPNGNTNTSSSGGTGWID